MKQVRKKLTYANVMSSIAVFMVLGGGAAVAANQLAKDSVGTKQLKRNAVKTPKIAPKAVKTAKIAPGAVKAGKLAKNSVVTGKIRNGAVTGTKIAADAVDASKVSNGSLSTAKLSDVRRIPLTRLAATDGADFEAAREAAPAHPLFSKGPLSVYAKCITDLGGSQTRVVLFGATTEAGSLMISWGDWLDGDPFLEPGTLEADRESLRATTSANDVSSTESMFQMSAPDGTSLEGQLYGYVKNGNPAGGNGIYGDGNVCLVSGHAFG